MKICVEVAEYLTVSVLSFESYAQSWLLLWFNVVSGQHIMISPQDLAYENAGYHNMFREYFSLIVVDCISLVVLSGLKENCIHRLVHCRWPYLGATIVVALGQVLGDSQHP